MSCLTASRFLQCSLPAATLLAALLMSGCATSTKTSEPVAVAPAVELPAAAAPAAELVPLTFMAGRWICVNPNKTVNEEHWTMPRGNSMYALFRQMRRDGKPALVDPVQRVGDLEIDPVRHRATRGGQRIDLTAKEFALLALLVQKAGEVLSRTQIASLVWDIHFDSETNVVDVAIRRLRAKIDDPYPDKLIHTVRGVGYVLEQRA